MKWNFCPLFYFRKLKCGRFPFTKKFRKFRLGCKWNMIFRFVPLENFRKKGNSWKGSPVFPVETSQWLPNGNLCSIYRFLVFITSSMPFAIFQAARRLSCFNKNGGWSGSVFWKLFANKLLGLLRVLCLPCYSARSGNFIAARMWRM